MTQPSTDRMAYLKPSSATIRSHHKRFFDYLNKVKKLKTVFDEIQFYPDFPYLVYAAYKIIEVQL